MAQNIYSMRLREIADALDDGEYLRVEKMTFESPAGDEYGLDNTCINFADKPKKDDYDNIVDIGDVLRILRNEDKEQAIKEHLDAIERIKRG